MSDSGFKPVNGLFFRDSYDHIRYRIALFIIFLACVWNGGRGLFKSTEIWIHDGNT